MTTVISVKFRGGSRLYYFSPGELEINAGDGVIVETARGTEYGDVMVGIHDVPDDQVIQPLKEVIRVATDRDREMRDSYRAKEKDAFATCMERIQAHGLDMKLVDVEYTFNELRQIGVRDEAKMLGGLGSCGRPVCCKQFLPDFQPVSIKMAKEQGLSLSPTKISGICGRLMCCLKYEQDGYEYMRKQMPKVGREAGTPEGLTGTVIENNVISERTKVKLMLPDGTIDVREYPFRELTYTRGGKGKQAQDIDVEAEVERQMMMDAEPEELAELLSEEKADMMERRMKDSNR